MSDPRSQIEELRDEIRKHERRYYQEASSEISDYEFDQLMHRLIALEERHPDLRSPDSPSVRVGGEPVEGFETVEHDPPMLSIDNAYSEEELRGVPCDQWLSLEQSYNEGGLGLSLTKFYGFDGERWRTNALGVGDTVRDVAYKRMKECGLR